MNHNYDKYKLIVICLISLIFNLKLFKKEKNYIKILIIIYFPLIYHEYTDS